MTELAIVTHNLSKIFYPPPPLLRPLSRPEAPKPAVNGVSLTVPRGELFGLLGPNGAGKTTLIKMLATLIEPGDGQAWVNGYPLHQSAAIQASIGLVTSDERSFYWRISGRDNLRFFGALHHLSGHTLTTRVHAALAQVNLLDVADKPFRTYSTGMRQRLSIARALLHAPQILFLDEPTRGLDPRSARQLHHLIREELVGQQGLTVFLTTHYLEEAERLCSRVAILDQGMVRGCGTLAELRSELHLAETYQIRVRGLKDPATLGEVQSLGADESLLTVQAESGRGELQATLDAIRTQGGRIYGLEQEGVSLERIFTALTEGTPRTPQFAAQPQAPANLSAEMQTRQEQRLSLGVQVRRGVQVMAAFLRRDWGIERSYRAAFVMQFGGVFLTMGVFYFIALLFGEGAAPFLAQYGGNYFAFVLLGVAFGSYFGVGLSSFASSIREAQTTGTLEAMLTTPTPLGWVIVSSSLWSYALTTFKVLVYLLGGVLLVGEAFAASGWESYAVGLTVLALTVLTFSSLGVLAASFIMVLKRGDPVTWLFSALSTLLGGVYYPPEVLPGWMQTLSALFPVTYALRALRLALLQGAGFADVAGDLLALAGFSVVLLPVSLWAFGVAVRLARRDGSLTHF
ncbi:MAG: hypothetical protein OHK0052_15560 [Anaerolineales bacterium]